MKEKVPDHCKDCKNHSKRLDNDGKRNNWCCWYGVPAKKVVGHCKNVGGKRI